VEKFSAVIWFRGEERVWCASPPMNVHSASVPRTGVVSLLVPAELSPQALAETSARERSSQVRVGRRLEEGEILLIVTPSLGVLCSDGRRGQAKPGTKVKTTRTAAGLGV
jgi:hypothetical protein